MRVFVNTWFHPSWHICVFKNYSEFDAQHLKKAKTFCCIGIHSLFSLFSVSGFCWGVFSLVAFTDLDSVLFVKVAQKLVQHRGKEQNLLICSNSLWSVFSEFWWWFLSTPDFTCLDGVQFEKLLRLCCTTYKGSYNSLFDWDPIIILLQSVLFWF